MQTYDDDKSPVPANHSSWYRYKPFLKSFSVFGLCFLVNLVCLSWSHTSSRIDIIWPANGILLGIILLSPRKVWETYFAYGFLASILARSVFQLPFATSLPIGFANTITLVIAAFAMRRHTHQALDLTRSSVFARFLLFGVILGPLCSALIIALSLSVPIHRLNQYVFINWFIVHSLGIAVVTPMILAIPPREVQRLIASERRRETLVLLIGFALVTIAVYGQEGYPISFLIFPALLLLVFRLGLSGATMGVGLVAFIASLFTVNSLGPFSVIREAFPLNRIIWLQFFLCVLLFTVYTVSRALSERDQLQAELSAAYLEASGLAGRDHLTGLANRRTFDGELSKEWQRATREHTAISLIMIDIDHFKKYNDYYGHIEGDACLQRVANVLAESLYRRTDVIARFGGEEFVILVPTSSALGVQIMAERLRKSVKALNLNNPGSDQGTITISAGVTTSYPAKTSSSLQQKLACFLETADSALYEAKRDGRDRVVCREQNQMEEISV